MTGHLRRLTSPSVPLGASPAGRQQLAVGGTDDTPVLHTRTSCHVDGDDPAGLYDLDQLRSLLPAASCCPVCTTPALATVTDLARRLTAAAAAGGPVALAVWRAGRFSRTHPPAVVAAHALFGFDTADRAVLLADGSCAALLTDGYIRQVGTIASRVSVLGGYPVGDLDRDDAARLVATAAALWDVRDRPFVAAWAEAQALHQP